ncbi:hypothetical protein IW140_001236 [Coemansia sp. RSA 1813]|nr:hypothetical protein EV178_001174 [Coemansia sp. RSA 1646]KAJ1772170.1 hypothetical protein LPJ74_001755 [Coemansia sp. RSA 1843]KAJ2091712.1 hypothetical protein IW138_001695 [Coemansia sp. RSA 986]KAJ2216885.1 hypothetical protein EV179_000919 [Coemansia sp. RSA 487]KAJ2571887.1 hypothetical protein IW140_001236 [Coemansia sp. RSA 1813]
MFGCIVAGRLVQTNIQQVDVNKYVFELSDAHSINHVVVFLLGTIPFEPGYAATVHLLWLNKSWQLLGALSNDKPSAIFRLKSTITPEEAARMSGTNAELGISIEPLQAVEQQIQQMKQQGNATTLSSASTSQSLVPFSSARTEGSGNVSGMPAQVARAFAERALQNLFDYAMSFTTRPDAAAMGMIGSNAPVQVLPVKVFEDWYNSFLRKVQRDPESSMQG